MLKRYIVRILAITSLLLLFGAGVGLVVFQARDGKLLSIQTGSMEPRLRKGGLVAVTNVDPGAVQPGDIITFINPANKKQTITHRVVGSRDNPMMPRKPYIVTKGDANSSPDTPVPQSAVVGKVREYAPYLGFGLDFVRKPVGLLILIYIPALVVIVGEMRRLIAYYKSKEAYVLPELLARRRQKVGHAGRNSALVAVVGVVAIAITVPVSAALQSQVTMTNNTIAGKALPPVAIGGLSLRRVFVGCTPSRLEIILYNAGKTDLNITGWYLQSGATKFYTFAATTVSHRSTFDFAAPVPPGVSYDSGSVQLYNAAGQLVDTSSWNHNPTGRPCRVL